MKTKVAIISTIAACISLAVPPALRPQSLDEGIMLYNQGARAYSHSAYRNELPGAWEKAFSIFKTHSFKDQRVVIAGNYLGSHFREQREYEKALEYYDWTLKIARIIDFKAHLILANIGNVHNRLGKYSLALKSYTDALEDFRESTDSADIGTRVGILVGIAYTHNELGHFKASLDMYQDILSLLADKEESTLAYILNNIGLVYDNLGRLDEALTHYRKSLELYEKLGFSGDSQKGNIADLYLADGRTEQAEAIYRELSQKIRSGKLHLAKGNYEGAVQYFMGALADDAESLDADFIFAEHVGLGIAYERLGKKKLAEEHFSKAIAVFNSIARELPDGERAAFLTVKKFGFSRAEPLNALERLKLVTDEE